MLQLSSSTAASPSPATGVDYHHDDAHHQSASHSEDGDSSDIGSDDDTEVRHGTKRKRKAKERKRKKKKIKKASRRSPSPARPRRKQESSSVHALTVFSATAPRTVWIEEAGLPADRAFRLDKKGDRGNLAYGSVYRRDIADYRRRFGHLACLGLPSDVHVDFSQGSVHGKKGSKLDDRGRYFSQSVVRQVQQSPLHSVDGKGTHCSGEMASLFLSLEAPSDEETGGKAKESTNTERSSEFSRQTRYYNDRLATDPHNVPLWLEFVQFQDKALYLAGLKDSEDSAGEPGPKKTASALARLERKIAILERALESNPGSIRLLCEHLSACEDVWEETKIAQRWKTLLHAHPASHSLWRRRLLFVRQRLSHFSFRSATNQFTRCLSSVAAINEGRMKSHAPEPRTCEFLVEVLSAYCDFLQQAGYCERAVALFQAAIEFNLFCPASLASLTTDRRAAFFETFWDGGAARFGEADARGWNAWMTEKSGGVHSPTTIDLPQGVGCAASGSKDKAASSDLEIVDEEEEEEKLVTQAKTRMSAWLQLEARREQFHWLPWRSPEECEDSRSFGARR